MRLIRRIITVVAIAIRCVGLALALGGFAATVFAQLAAPPRETVISVPNGGFENGDDGWELIDGRDTCRVTDAQAAGGKHSLLIARQPGSRVTIRSGAIACQGPALVQVRGKFLSKWGYYLYLHLQQFDAAGDLLPEPAEARIGTFGADAIWQPLEGWRGVGPVWLHPETARVRILLEGTPHPENALEVYFDGLEILNFGLPIPPWPGQYKLKPADKARLTAADVVGPDGIVYPNWTRVGVQGGIPDVPVKVDLDDLGAKPQTDISGLLTSAVAQVGAQGGGAILIGKGVFYLHDPVVIRQSGIVIRGSGRDATRLVFRYSLARPEAKFPGGWPDPSVFAFRGRMEEGDRKRLLIADGKRGDTLLKVGQIADLKAGDKFIVRAPSTPRWESLTRHKETVGWGIRINAYEAKAVRGESIAIGQPLRIDFPVVDGAYIRKIMPVERCGIEDMTVEHACRMPFDTLNSDWAWNCWARRLNVVKCGRSGVHFRNAKWCEVRDCDFDGFDPAAHRAHENWWAYGGFTCAWDCLMENTACRRFRHAPQVQFGAQGNVIRNSVFDGSDAQWHAGWSTENLFENCTIGPSGPYGSYGFGMYSTPSQDATHGPNGPRNVVYHCDVSSDKDGVFASGTSEGWLFLHNRFQVGVGSGFLASDGFFDAIVRHNVFILKNTQSPMVLLRTPDCVGMELIGNTVLGGSGRIADGAVKPALDKDNRVLPAWKWGEPPPNRPKADPPSIYEWQFRTCRAVP